MLVLRIPEMSCLGTPDRSLVTPGSGWPMAVSPALYFDMSQPASLDFSLPGGRWWGGKGRAFEVGHR